ncbi:MAG: hypothetical protein IJL97_03740 [Lachnospiraceae bacterium]|nr:hypothetical protein [Clostridia bacterium]MBR0085643.1 hypothetical protein [Lachnospiraceae bacterium]
MIIKINGVDYTFEYNFGFVRKINQRVTANVGDNKAKQNQGLMYAIAQIIDGDVETLADVLYAANAGQDPRISMDGLEAYISDPETDIDELFQNTLDFFGKSNCTKKVYKRVLEAQEKAEQMAGM